MCCIRRDGDRRCSVEFNFWGSRKRKLLNLKKLIFSVSKGEILLGGEICGIDFSVEKVSQKLKTENILLQNDSNGYATLYFLTREESDFGTIIDRFDSFSEGCYTMYLFPEEEWNGGEINLKEIGLMDFLMKVSVYSDATYIEFDFKDEEICREFIAVNSK